MNLRFRETLEKYWGILKKYGSWCVIILGAVFFVKDGMKAPRRPGAVLGDAFTWYRRKAAERGDASAQYGLGYRYANGLGVKKSAKDAALWYRKAAEQGNANAQYELGVCYTVGRGVEKSAEKAARWLRNAAESGYAGATGVLGHYYCLGGKLRRR